MNNIHLKKPNVFLLTLSLLGGLILLGSLVLVLTVTPVWAANITVNSTADTTADDGVCTLREAIIAANTDTASGATAGECAAGSGADTITFNGNYSIDISANGELAISEELTINGGANTIIIDAGDNNRIFNITAGPVTLTNLQLQHGSANNGGAIASTAAVAVTNSTIISNTATGMGGAIYSTDALNISGSTFDRNRANGTTEGTGGSVIYTTGALVMDSTDVLSNSTGRDYTIYANGPVTVTNSLFQNNEIGDDGGALYAYNDVMYLADSFFIENVGYDTTGSGQCMVTTYAGGVVTGTQFLRNTLESGSGTLCVLTTGDVAITNSQFISNTASGNGGGLYATTTGAVTISNSDFTDNTANQGGGIFATSDITVTNGNFSGNTSTLFGGAIENGGKLNVTNSTFDGNTSTNESGSAIFNDGAPAVLQVENSTFMHNTVVNEWSTVENSGGTALITNSTFYSNTAYGATGFVANGGTSTLVNNTFSDNDNTGATNPYTVFGTPASTLNLYNNIIANTVTGIDCGGTIATNTNNLVEDDTCSPTVSGDPLLGSLEYTGLGGTGVLPLQAGSPAIDAGDDASAPTTDQRGVARPQGSQSDIGAYEADAGEADLAVSQSIALNFLFPVFTIVVDNNGPDAAPGAVVSVTFPVEVTGVAWTCAGSGGAVCPNASGSGNTINETVATFPAGGQLTYTVDTTYVGPPVSNLAEVVPPAGIVDPDMTNNESTQVTSYTIILPVVYHNASFTP